MAFKVECIIKVMLLYLWTLARPTRSDLLCVKYNTRLPHNYRAVVGAH